VSFPLESYPLTGILGNGQVDMQVMALFGNEVPTNYENGSVYGFDGLESVWSSTQTITVPVSSSSPTPVAIGSLALILAFSIIVVIIALVITLLLYKRHRKFASSSK